MKSPKEAFLYFTGIDYVLNQLKKEQGIRDEASGKINTTHLDTPIKAEPKIILNRAKTIVVFPGLLAARATGVALAYQKIKEVRSKRVGA
jgi:hypothetical protein